MSGAGRGGPTVPGTGSARTLAWVAIALASLAPLARPAPPGRLVAVEADPDCVWGAARQREPLCPCARLGGALRLQARLPLPLNAATADDLVALRGIGPRRAAAIVADRTRRGAFPDVGALARVPGIGSGTLRKLAPALAVGRDPCVAPVALPGHGGDRRDRGDSGRKESRPEGR